MGNGEWGGDGPGLAMVRVSPLYAAYHLPHAVCRRMKSACASHESWLMPRCPWQASIASAWILQCGLGAARLNRSETWREIVVVETRGAWPQHTHLPLRFLPDCDPSQAAAKLFPVHQSKGYRYSRVINTVLSYTIHIRYRYNVSSHKSHWSRSKTSRPSSRTSTLRSKGSRDASSSLIPVRAKSSSSLSNIAISFCKIPRIQYAIPSQTRKNAPLAGYLFV